VLDRQLPKRLVIEYGVSGGRGLHGQNSLSPQLLTMVRVNAETEEAPRVTAIATVKNFMMHKEVFQSIKE
jgi:hypothetical protein